MDTGLPGFRFPFGSRFAAGFAQHPDQNANRLKFQAWVEAPGVHGGKSEVPRARARRALARSNRILLTYLLTYYK